MRPARSRRFRQRGASTTSRSRPRSAGIWRWRTSGRATPLARGPSSMGYAGRRARSPRGPARPRRDSNTNNSEAGRRMDSAVARWFACVAGVLAVVVSLSADQSNTAADTEFAVLLSAAQRSYSEHDWDRSTTIYQTLMTAARAKGASLWEG